MGIFRNFPYTNFHEFNEDWIVSEIKRLAAEWAEYNGKWDNLYSDITNAFNDFKDQFDEYIASIDYSGEITKRVDQLVADGTFSRIVTPKISPIVTSWLEENITLPEGVVIDQSLSIQGAAADAKSAGDKINDILFNLYWDNVYDIIHKNSQVESGTRNGVTYTWNSSNTVTMTGTASPDSFSNIYFNQSRLPEGVSPNYNLSVVWLDVNSSLNFIWYDSKGATIQSVHVKGHRNVKVPANAVGAVIRVYVNSGTSVDATVHPYILRQGFNHNMKYMGLIEQNGYTFVSIPINTIALATGSEAGAPSNVGSGYLITIGDIARCQLYIETTTGNTFYRWARQTGNTWSFNKWVPYNGNGNQYAKMLVYGNSIMSGSVWTSASGVDTIAAYGNSPYSVIADSINIPQSNVENHMLSSTGLMYDAGKGNFLTNIKNTDISGYDVILTHLWLKDMDYNLGTMESPVNNNTICGKVKELVRYIKSVNPSIQLILCSVPPCSTAINGEDVFTGLYPNNKSITQLDTLMHTLADQEKFIYIDWQDLNFAKVYQSLTWNGNNVHLASEAAYRKLGAYAGARASKEIHF